MNDPLIELVEKSKHGDLDAAGNLLTSIQGNIYKIALKYFWCPVDAEEVTQEALLKIFTSLSTFSGQSLFSTWAYRVSVNHFLNIKRKNKLDLSFDDFELRLEQGLGAVDNDNLANDPILINEIKVGCSQGMLQSLSSQQRIAYILGEILEVSSAEGAEIMEISKESFRQLLSRSRKLITDFTRKICGITSETATCSCVKQLQPAISSKKIDVNNLLFDQIGEIEKNISNISQIISTSELFHKTSVIRKRFTYIDSIKQVLKALY